MPDIVMPRLSDSMTEGTVVRWLKPAGAMVQRGEPLVEIETDKATITYESDTEGVLSQILVGEGETVAVGTPIALIGAPVQQQAPAPLLTPTPPAPAPAPTPPLPTPTEAFPAEDAFAGTQSEGPPDLQTPAEAYPADDTFSDAPRPSEPFFNPDTGGFTPVGQYGEGYTGEQEAAQQPTGEHERLKASPVARRLARKLGVDLAAVQGSGPGGRIVKEDVEASAESAAQAAQQAPTQSPAPAPAPLPTPEYAYEPGGVEQHEDEQIMPPDFQQEPHEQPAYEQPAYVEPAYVEPAHEPPAQQPTPPAPTPEPEPPLIPNFPPPPAPAPPPPAYGQQPYGYPPQQYPQPQQQPFPGPPPFVQGMTGGFPAIPRPDQPFQQQQQPQQPQPPQPPPQQPPAQQPGGTATRGAATPIEPTNAQQTVARRMAESKATAPEFFVETEVDMTACVTYREQMRGYVEPLPSFNDFVIKAAAMALRQYPNVNAAYKDGHFEQYSDVNIGVVVSASELLAVPTLFNVDQKGLAQLARESHELSEAVRNRTIQPNQMTGGTFSISNLGMYGIERFTAILNPPQAAILAVGAITRKAVIAEDGMSLVVRQIMNVTLTCDHRILYGAEAAEFLGAIKAWLESPQLLQV